MALCDRCHIFAGKTLVPCYLEAWLESHAEYQQLVRELDPKTRRMFHQGGGCSITLQSHCLSHYLPSSHTTSGRFTSCWYISPTENEWLPWLPLSSCEINIVLLPTRALCLTFISVFIICRNWNWFLVWFWAWKSVCEDFLNLAQRGCVIFLTVLQFPLTSLHQAKYVDQNSTKVWMSVHVFLGF